MTPRPAITSPVRLEVADDRLRVTVDATAGGREVHVVAYVSARGVIEDLQASSGADWSPGTTGDKQLDQLVLAAIEQAFTTAQNVLAVLEVDRRAHFYRTRRSRA